MSAGEPETGSQSAAGRTSTRWRTLRHAGFQAIGVGLFYIFAVAFFAVFAPQFATFTNVKIILENAAVIGFVAVGQTLAIVSGGFDLSVAGVMPLAGVAYAMMTNAGLDLWVAMPLAVLIGTFIGLINGLIVTRLKINPLITTLGTLSITSGLAFIICNGLTQVFDDPRAGFLADKGIAGASNFVPIYLAVVVVTYLVLRYAVFGRKLYAIGGNAEASRLAGIRIDLLTTVVYMISGSTAAFAGVVLASQLLAGSATVGSQAALQSVAAVILGGASLTGGKGGIVGTVIGVFVLGTIANGMALMQVQSFWQQVATGAVLLFAVGFEKLRESLQNTQS